MIRTWRASAWRGRLGALLGLTMALALTACGDDSDGSGQTPNPEPVNHSLTVSKTGSGSVTGAAGAIQCGTSCTASLAANTAVTLTASPAAGSRLASWGGACSGQAASCSFSMDGAKSVTASFELIPAASFALDVVVAGQGTVNSSPAGIQCGSACRADFSTNATVTLTATPAQGQVLSAWSGACTGQAATCQVSMSAARAVTATFAPAPVAARAWQTAQLLESSNDFNITSTSTAADLNALTAIDPNGNAMVIWAQSDGTPDGNTLKVYSRRYVAGQGWAAAVQVAGLASTSNLVTGRLLMDAAGHALWVRHDFQAWRYSPTSGWASAAVVPAGSFAGSLADAKLDAAGVVHMLRSGDGNAWHTSLSVSAGAYAPWTDVAANATANRVLSDGVRLALGSGGRAMAVWRERNPGDAFDSVWASRRLTSGAWQTPVRIEEVLTNARARPALAIDDNGNAIAAWHQGDSLYVNRFSASAGTWGTATEMDAGQVSSTFNARVDLVMMGDGRAVVSWNSGLFAMKSSTYAPTTGFGTPVTVAPYSIDRSMGVDQQGRVVIVYRSPSQWPNPTDGTQNIYTRSMTLGGSWSDAALLESAAGDTKGNAPFAMNGAGQAVCVWAQNDLASSTVRNSLWANLLR